jgi:predicted metal-dependent hydrolase
MAVKQFDLPDIGQVFVYKRAGVRNLRLTIRSDGSVRVTIPAWSPYITGVNFARSRAEWIRKHAVVSSATLADGQPIGKSHHLKFVAIAALTKPATRIRQNEVVVSYPATLTVDNELVQKMATTASLRALKAQASHLLPQRLADLARRHGFDYKSVTIKQLKSRWGSCDQHKNITLNLFLMQLPWHLIDYVLLHELTHTRVMRHGPPFWSAMAAVEPKTQALRREIKSYKTTIG